MSRAFHKMSVLSVNVKNLSVSENLTNFFLLVTCQIVLAGPVTIIHHTPPLPASVPTYNLFSQNTTNTTGTQNTETTNCHITHNSTTLSYHLHHEKHFLFKNLFISLVCPFAKAWPQLALPRIVVTAANALIHLTTAARKNNSSLGIFSLAPEMPLDSGVGGVVVGVAMGGAYVTNSGSWNKGVIMQNGASVEIVNHC